MTHHELPAASAPPPSSEWADLATLASSSTATDAKNISKRRVLDSIGLLVDATCHVFTLGQLGGSDMLPPPSS